MKENEHLDAAASVDADLSKEEGAGETVADDFSTEIFTTGIKPRDRRIRKNAKESETEMLQKQFQIKLMAEQMQMQQDIHNLVGAMLVRTPSATEGVNKLLGSYRASTAERITAWKR